MYVHLELPCGREVSVAVEDSEWTVGDVLAAAGARDAAAVYEGEELAVDVLLAEAGVDDGDVMAVTLNGKERARRECRARGLKRNMNALLGAVGRGDLARTQLLLATEEIDINNAPRVVFPPGKVWGGSYRGHAPCTATAGREGRPFTPILNVAVAAGNLAMVRLLLAAGAEVNPHAARVRCPVSPVQCRGRPRPWGASPLHVAARMYRGGSTEMIDVLLAAGANPNAADSWGDTPLSLLTRIRGADVDTRPGIDAVAAAGGRLDWRHPMYGWTLFTNAIMTRSMFAAQHLATRYAHGGTLDRHKKWLPWAMRFNPAGAGYWRALVLRSQRRVVYWDDEVDPDDDWLDPKLLNARGSGKAKAARNIFAAPRTMRRTRQIVAVRSAVG